MPETFDVDHAFEALAQDVMHRAGPPSAVNAINQARHRRRTALATGAAALALVVGSVAVTTLTGGDGSSGNVATEGLRPLPAPAEFAPDGWGPVDDAQPDSLTTLACLASFLKVSPQPLIPVATGEALRGRGDDRLVAFFLDFGDDAAAAEEAVSFATDPSNGCGASTQEVRYNGGQVQHFAETEGSLATDLWVTRLTNRVGITVAISDVAATPGQRLSVADSSMGALQFPGTWEPTTTEPSASSSETAFGSEIDPAAIDRVFGGWFTAWRQAPVDGVLPCVSLTRSQPSSGSGSMPGGGVRVQSYAWPTEAEAEVARERILTSLAECNSVKWSLANTGPTTWVVTSDAGTLWVAQSTTLIGLIEARDGVNPPAQVTSAVTELLMGEIERATR